MEPRRSTSDATEVIFKMLTGAVEAGSVQEALYLRNQRESPLLRLPAELRQKIYDYFFYDYQEPILSLVRDFIGDKSYKHGVHDVQIFLWDDKVKYVVPRALSPENTKEDLRSSFNFNYRLKFQYVCRQILTETTHLPFTPYKCKAFLPSLVTSARQLQSWQLHAIHNFHLVIYNIKEMESLPGWDDSLEMINGKGIGSLETFIRRILREFCGIKHLVIEDHTPEGSIAEMYQETGTAGISPEIRIEVQKFDLLGNSVECDMPV